MTCAFSVTGAQNTIGTIPQRSNTRTRHTAVSQRVQGRAPAGMPLAGLGPSRPCRRRAAPPRGGAPTARSWDGKTGPEKFRPRPYFQRRKVLIAASSIIKTTGSASTMNLIIGFRLYQARARERLSSERDHAVKFGSSFRNSSRHVHCSVLAMCGVDGAVAVALCEWAWCGDGGLL